MVDASTTSDKLCLKMKTFSFLGTFLPNRPNRGRWTKKLSVLSKLPYLSKLKSQPFPLLLAYFFEPCLKNCLGLFREKDALDSRNFSRRIYAKRKSFLEFLLCGFAMKPYARAFSFLISVISFCRNHLYQSLRSITNIRLTFLHTSRKFAQMFDSGKPFRFVNALDLRIIYSRIFGLFLHRPKLFRNEFPKKVYERYRGFCSFLLPHTPCDFYIPSKASSFLSCGLFPKNDVQLKLKCYSC